MATFAPSLSRHSLPFPARKKCFASLEALFCEEEEEEEEAPIFSALLFPIFFGAKDTFSDNDDDDEKDNFFRNTYRIR